MLNKLKISFRTLTVYVMIASSILVAGIALTSRAPFREIFLPTLAATVLAFLFVVPLSILIARVPSELERDSNAKAAEANRRHALSLIKKELTENVRLMDTTKREVVHPNPDFMFLESNVWGAVRANDALNTLSIDTRLAIERAYVLVEVNKFLEQHRMEAVLAGPMPVTHDSPGYRWSMSSIGNDPKVRSAMTTALAVIEADLGS